MLSIVPNGLLALFLLLQDFFVQSRHRFFYVRYMWTQGAPQSGAEDDVRDSHSSMRYLPPCSTVNIQLILKELHEIAHPEHKTPDCPHRR